MLEMEVDERMLGELEGMGFDKTLAAKALSSSGIFALTKILNLSVEACMLNVLLIDLFGSLD